MSFILVHEPPAWTLPDSEPTATPRTPEASQLPAPAKSTHSALPPRTQQPPIAKVQPTPINARADQPTPQPSTVTASTTQPASVLQSRIRVRERRWSERIAMTRAGRLSLGESGISVACQVLDLSRFGAMLEVDQAGIANSNFDLPNCFLLTFTSGRMRSEADCVIRWRGDGRIGVNFIGNVRTFVASQTN
jgi:hypothetical protein